MYEQEHSNCMSRFYDIEARDMNDFKMIQIALDHFPDTDFSDYRLLIVRTIDGISFADFQMRIVVIDSRMHGQDFLFTLIHEFRHVEQNQKKAIEFNAIDKVVIWKTNRAYMHMSLDDVNLSDIDKYLQFPWEKDANGYAFACMSNVNFNNSPNREVYRQAQHYAEILMD